MHLRRYIILHLSFVCFFVSLVYVTWCNLNADIPQGSREDLLKKSPPPIFFFLCNTVSLSTLNVFIQMYFLKFLNSSIYVTNTYGNTYIKFRVKQIAWSCNVLCINIHNYNYNVSVFRSYFQSNMRKGRNIKCSKKNWKI